MSQLSNLNSDFLTCALDDLGQNVTVTHYASQFLNAATGDYTAVEQEQTISAVIQSVTKKDILLSPNKYLGSDRTVFFREADLSISLQINDKVVYESDEYSIFEILSTHDIYKLVIRKAD